MSVPTLRHDDSLSSDDNPENHTPVTPASASQATPIHRRTSMVTVGSLPTSLRPIGPYLADRPSTPAGSGGDARAPREVHRARDPGTQASRRAPSTMMTQTPTRPPRSRRWSSARKAPRVSSSSCSRDEPGGIAESHPRAARHGLVPSSAASASSASTRCSAKTPTTRSRRRPAQTPGTSAALDHSFVSSASTSSGRPARRDGTASLEPRHQRARLHRRGRQGPRAHPPRRHRRSTQDPEPARHRQLREGLGRGARTLRGGSFEPPAKTGAATAHTVATLLNDDAFFSAALRAKDARDVRAAVLTFVEQKSGSGGANDGGGEVDSIHRTPPPLHPTRAKSRFLTPRSSFEWPFASVARDARYRLPHYVSDWTDAFRDGYAFSKTINATVWLYFSTLAPALALGVVLREETRGAIGPTEVLLAEGVGNMAFSLVAGSPLLVLRVTGTSVAWTKILSGWFHGGGGVFAGEDFLAFHAAVGLWCAGFVVFIASVGGAGLMRHAGSFTHEILAALVSGIFIRSGVAEVVAASAVADEMDDAEVDEHPAFFLKHLMLFLGTFYVARAVLGFQRSRFLGKNTRTVIADMAPAISLVSLTLLSYAVSPDVGVKREARDRRERREARREVSQR